MPNFVAVNSSVHKDIKVKEDKTFAHVKSQHMVPVVVHEFSKAAQEYPIIFVKDSDGDKFRAVALLGLKAGENLFYSDDVWRAQYVPESILGYPFILAPDNNDKEKHVLVMNDESERLTTDEESDVVTRTLFDEEGNQSEFTVNLGKFLSEHLGKQIQTNAFIEKLNELKIIEKQVLEVNIGDKEKFNIDGVYIINEKSFNELSDKDFKELRKLGYIGPIYAALISMNRIGSLVKMMNELKAV
ncbi:MAG: SapC family protein [Kangiellaceae bacterium]